jgi:outer membrane protein TolC
MVSLSSAIAEGMKNNFQVLMARNDSLSDAAVSSAGSAGFLPVVSMNAGLTKASNNIRQEFSNGIRLERDAVGSDAYNGGMALSWTIFDGMRMFVTRDKMNEIRALGQIRVRQAMEATVEEITVAYYRILLEKSKKEMLEKILPLYEERYHISKLRNEIGNGNRNDLLMASADLAQQRAEILRQEGMTELAYNRLKEASGAPLNESILVEDVAFAEEKEFERILNAAAQRRAGNARIEFLQKQVNIHHYGLLESKAQVYPRLGLSVNYNINNVQNQAGFALLNRNLGLNAGLNLSWTIFDGFALKRSIAMAGIAENAARIQLRQEQQLQDYALGNALIQLGRALNILKIEREVQELTEENVKLMTEKFRLAQCSSLELKEAQSNFVQAGGRVLTAMYEAGIAAAAVRRLAGKI